MKVKELILIIVLAIMAFLIATGLRNDYGRLTVQDKQWVQDRFNDAPWN
jgi:Na+(H+)/acetate symporter ActP